MVKGVFLDGARTLRSLSVPTMHVNALLSTVQVDTDRDGVLIHPRKDL